MTAGTARSRRLRPLFRRALRAKAGAGGKEGRFEGVQRDPILTIRSFILFIVAPGHTCQERGNSHPLQIMNGAFRLDSGLVNKPGSPVT